MKDAAEWHGRHGAAALVHEGEPACHVGPDSQVDRSFV
jgi:hypothetical protein